MIKQVSIFLENNEGRLASASRILGDAGFVMHILMIADTSDYGVARIIVDKPNAAAKVLRDNGFQVKLVDVVAVKIPDRAGGLADLLMGLDERSLNLEYAYCVSLGKDDFAIDVLRIDGAGDIEAIISEMGFETLQASELYKVD